MTSVAYSARSIRDLGELLAYVGAQNETNAAALAATIKAAVERLAHDPRLLIPTGTQRVGRYSLKKQKITIFAQYLPRRKELRIVRIIRGSRVKRLSKAP